MIQYPSIPNIKPSSSFLDSTVYVSEKIHGANLGLTKKDGVWRVCSKHFMLPADDKVFFKGVANKIVTQIIEPKFDSFDSIYIYGELYGPGIHGGVDWYKPPIGWPSDIPKFLKIFDVMIDGRYLTPEEFNSFAEPYGDLFVKKTPIIIKDSYLPLINHINSMVGLELMTLDDKDSLYNLNIKLYNTVSDCEGVVLDTNSGKWKMVFPRFKESKGNVQTVQEKKHIDITLSTFVNLTTPVRIGKRLADLGGERDADKLLESVINDIKEELINDGRYKTNNLDIMVEKNRKIRESIRKAITEYFALPENE